jgi:hypothetical protein
VNISDLIGLIFVVLFFALILAFAITGRGRTKRYLRDISAFARLKRGIGLAVEAGQRLHISLGSGGIIGVQGASGLVGLSMLQRIARAASTSDRPPVSTSGEATLAVLSQDTLKSVYRAIGAEHQYEPTLGQVSGLTPFSYAAGALPVVFDHQVAVNILSGHFGSEVALLTDAAERNGALTLAGSDSLPAQAVLYVTAQEPLIGEELYAGGAYIQAGPLHLASVRAQDIMRWVLVAGILVGAVLKLAGVL